MAEIDDLERIGNPVDAYSQFFSIGLLLSIRKSETGKSNAYGYKLIE